MKAIAILAAALFATATLAPVAIAAEKDKKPTKDECKKDPTIKGCDAKK